ncbi:MAG: quinone oxidoreductase family protein [Phycisphaerae bacterium]
MKAWLLEKLGGVENLHLAEITVPVPGVQDVLMEVIYSALNPADRYLAEGQYPARPPLPHILGRDGVGRIVAVGGNVKGWKVGDKALIIRGPVGVQQGGTFAEKVVVPAECLAVPPQNWTLQQCAGASLVYLTAWQALTQWGELAPSVVLVTGASGGVGVASVQLAQAMGHKVVAFSRHSEKRMRLSEMGAKITLDPANTQWRKELLQLLAGKRVDLVVDNIGGPQFSELLDVMGMWGKISVVGRLAGPVPQFNTASLLFRRLRIGGVAPGNFTAAEARVAWEAVLKILARRDDRPVVDSVVDFDQLPQAFARLASGPMGKVLLRVAGE